MPVQDGLRQNLKRRHKDWRLAFHNSLSRLDTRTIVV